MSPKLRGWDEADGNRFPVIPAGQYHIRCYKCIPHASGEQAKHPGRPGFKTFWKVAPGEDQEGRVVPYYMSMPCDEMEDEEYDRRVNEVKHVYIACNLEAEGGAPQPDHELIGAECCGAISVETPDKGPFAGKEQNVIKEFLQL